MPGRGPLASALGDRYRIERELGAGGMALVYLARDVKHDRDVAIKVLPPELGTATGEQRFLNEIRITSKLHHPHILTLIDSGASSGTLWYVVPYVRGESLRQRLQREGQLPTEDAISITRQIASALDFAHAQGVVHRDVKPENILLHEGVAMLADFGIALAVEEAAGDRLTGTGLSVGTPQYMSPEQATRSRHLDSRTDVYSLGAVLYEMLAGEPPHTGANPQAVYARLLTEKPTPLRLIRDSIPIEIEEAVARALARVPADRFASAGEFAEALTAKRRSPSRWAGQARRVVATGGLALLLAGGVWLLKGPLSSRPDTPSVPEISQLTSSGHASSPMLSPDGSQIAFVRTTCDDQGNCTQGVMLREAGEDVERVVAEGVKGRIDLRGWSPSGLRLLYTSYDSVDHSVTFVVPRLGGTPVRVGQWSSGGFAGSDDTLLVEPPGTAPTGYLYLVLARSGEVVDSLPLPEGVPRYTPFVIASDGERVAWWRRASGGRTAIVLLDRRLARTVTDTIEDAALSLHWQRGSAALIYARRMSSAEHVGLFRRTVDRRTGRVSRVPETIVTGLEVGTVGVAYDLTADARTAVYARRRDLQLTMWAIERLLPKGPFRRVRAIRSATRDFDVEVSGDGRTIFTREITNGPEGDRTQYFAEPYAGGTVRPVAPAMTGVSDYSIAMDGSRMLIARVERNLMSLSWYDVASGEASHLVDLPEEKRVITWIVRGGGVAWMRPGLDTVHVLDREGRPVRTIALPDSVRPGFPLSLSPDGTEIGLITVGSRPGRYPWGIWRLSLMTGQLSLVTHMAPFSSFYGVAWTNDGWLHMNMTAYGSIHPHMFRVPVQGGNFELETTLPFEGTVTPFSLARDGLHGVAIETAYQSDLMLARLNPSAAH